jgi:class 3 adenylate cyclase
MYMGLENDLKTAVKNIYKETWKVTDGKVVPDADNLTLSNTGVKLDATVLYADLDGSTNLVDQYTPTFAAEIYKTYLHCAAKIIESEGGVITAYDGDRIMAVFIGGLKNTTAARCGLKINHAVTNIINPLIKECYPNKTFVLKQVVGIDTSTLMAAKTGVRGANDLVWVGRAANYAAKLCSISSDYSTIITKSVYDSMLETSKLSSDGKQMWEAATWTTMNNMGIYRSKWRWHVDFNK